MIERNFFAVQMGRLAVLFEPGRFRGELGKIRLREMYPFFQNGYPADLEKAVNSVIEEYDESYKVFPRVALILKHVRAAAIYRQDQTPRLPEPEYEHDREKVAKIIREAGFKSIMDKSNA